MNNLRPSFPSGRAVSLLLLSHGQPPALRCMICVNHSIWRKSFNTSSSIWPSPVSSLFLPNKSKYFCRTKIQRASVVDSFKCSSRSFQSSATSFVVSNTATNDPDLTEKFDHINTIQDPVEQDRLFKTLMETPFPIPSGTETTVGAMYRQLITASRYSSIFFGVVLISLIFSIFTLFAHAEVRSLIQDTSIREPSTDDLRKTQLKHNLATAQSFITASSKYFGKEITQSSIKYWQWWINLTPAEKAAYTIAGVNIAVYGAWRLAIFRARSPSVAIPKLVYFMSRWFVHSPIGRVRDSPITSLTSAFSHQTFFHLAFNTICMTSFAAGAGYFISSIPVQSGQTPRHRSSRPDLQELSGKYQFLATYASAGVFASICSGLWAARLGASAIRTANFDKWVRATTPGLGASGAVYAIVVISVLENPHRGMALIFFPFIAFPAMYGLMGMLALDTYGLLAGWRTFGHAAHLGGAAFGAMYHAYGPPLWAKWRGPETKAFLIKEKNS